MKHNWDTYKNNGFFKGWYDGMPIGKILTKKRIPAEIVDTDTYKQITVKVNHQGVTLRGLKKGFEIGSKQYLANEGDFIISKIDARNGSMGIIPPELDNAIVTGDFPLYNIVSTVNLEFFNLFTKTPYFDRACKWASEGSTNRRRIKIDRFNRILFPLPPLSEQKRIVAKIESVKSKIETIRKIRAEQEKEWENLLFSKYTEIIEGVEWVPMDKVAPIIRRSVEIDMKKSYPELGVRSFGKGTFHKPEVAGIDVGSKRLFQIKSNDLIFSNVFAWEGAIAIAEDEDNNRYGSHRFISTVTNEDIAQNRFLLYHFLSPKGMEDINACSPGGAGRNKTLGLKKLMKISVPIPSLTLQEEFIEFLEKTKTIRQHYQAQEEELEELLSSLLDKAFKGEL